MPKPIKSQKDLELGKARRLIVALIHAHVDKNEKEFKRLIEEDSKAILTTQGYEYVVALLNPELLMVPVEA